MNQHCLVGLRVVMLFTGGVLAAVLASCEDGAKSPAEEVLPIRVAGQEFRMPLEHVPGDVPIAVGASGESADGVFVAHFSAGWLAMHVLGYQPVTNESLLGVAVYVKVARPGETLPPVVPPIAEDAWYGRGTFAERVVDGARDPHTGLYVIKAGPVPADGRLWLGLLASTPPVPSDPLPEDWYVLACNHTVPALIPRAGSVTRCYLNAHAAPDVYISVNVAGENLRFREDILDTIGREILSWRVATKRSAG